MQLILSQKIPVFAISKNSHYMQRGASPAHQHLVHGTQSGRNMKIPKNNSLKLEQFTVTSVVRKQKRIFWLVRILNFSKTPAKNAHLCL